MGLHPTHARLLDAVNHAKTEREHREAEATLDGWRMGFRDAGRNVDLCGADLYYLDQDIDRPMCCGVWLDWTPAPVTDTEGDPR